MKRTSLTSHLFHSFNFPFSDSVWSLASEFLLHFCNNSDGIIIKALIGILWSWLSFTHSSMELVHSSTYFSPAFPEGRINKFFFHFMAYSYVEETTCCSSMMERFPPIFISVDGCTVTLWVVILSVFSLGLHFFDV